MKSRYNQQLDAYRVLLKDIQSTKSLDFIELSFERLFETDDSIEDILEWYKKQKSNCKMSVEHIHLKDCKGWSFDKASGSLVHESGEFFIVEGLRVTNSIGREVTGGWDQPIVTQVGFDGGILGLLRKRIDGIPHYLVEAKSEPGNPGIVQISTTVQATFSNLKKAHGGSQTLYSEYFLKPEDNGGRVIFERWMSEDGGRLFNKRNKSMIVEVNDTRDIDLERFRWVKLSDLIKITNETDAIVAPHLRGILSVL